MKILNFLEFTLNESTEVTPDEFYKVPGVNNFMEDGYEISARNHIESDEYPAFEISAIEENPTAIKICYCDEHGNPMEDIWLPKDSLDVKMQDQDDIIITIHPECRWINDSSNREKLEEFIENFDNFRTDQDDKENRRSESIKDDLENFLDAIGFEVSVKDINNTGNGQYEVYLDNDLCATVNKRSLADIIGKISLYREKIIGDPCIEITGDRNGITLVSNIPDLFKKEVECQIDDFEDNPYLRYLLKKPLDLDTNSDRENLASYYSSVQRNHDKGRYESEDEKVRTSAREESYHIKDLRKMLSQFLSEERLRKISTDY